MITAAAATHRDPEDIFLAFLEVTPLAVQFSLAALTPFTVEGNKHIGVGPSMGDLAGANSQYIGGLFPNFK